MGLTKTIIPMRPTENEIRITLILKDDERPDLGAGMQIVIDKTFTENVPSGEVMSEKTEKEFTIKAQKAIDYYKTIRSRYEAVYGDKISKIDSALKL